MFRVLVQVIFTGAIASAAHGAKVSLVALQDVTGYTANQKYSQPQFGLYYPPQQGLVQEQPPLVVLGDATGSSSPMMIPPPPIRPYPPPPVHANDPVMIPPPPVHTHNPTIIPPPPVAVHPGAPSTGMVHIDDVTGGHQQQSTVNLVSLEDVVGPAQSRATRSPSASPYQPVKFVALEDVVGPQNIPAYVRPGPPTWGNPPVYVQPQPVRPPYYYNNNHYGNYYPCADQRLDKLVEMTSVAPVAVPGPDDIPLQYVRSGKLSEKLTPPQEGAKEAPAWTE